MTKVKSLIDKYGIACLSNSNLEMFISEIYGDGYQACEEKYKDKLGLRDHFAGLAMQGICASAPNVEWTDALISKEAYRMADAMLAERVKQDDR